jgi:MFS family permease
LIFALFGSSGAVIDDLRVLLAMRFIAGCASALGMTSLITAIGTQFEFEARSRWLGYLIMTGSVYGVTLTLLSGILGQFDWRAVFLVHLIALPIAGFMLWSIRGIVFQKSEKMTVPPPRLGAGAFRSGMVMVALGGACGAVVYGSGAYVPFFLHSEIHLGSLGIARVLICGSVGAIVGSWGFGKVRKVLSTNPTFIVAFGIGAAGYFILGLSTTSIGAGIGMVLAGGGTGLAQPVLYELAALLGRNIDGQARNVSIAKSAFLLGPFAVQLLLTLVASNPTTVPIIALSLICATTAAVVTGVALFGSPRRPQAV